MAYITYPFTARSQLEQQVGELRSKSVKFYPFLPSRGAGDFLFLLNGYSIYYRIQHIQPTSISLFVFSVTKIASA